MSIIDTYYEKIKLLINEYENILQLDKEYMTEYLKHCGKDLQIDLESLSISSGISFTILIHISKGVNTSAVVSIRSSDLSIFDPASLLCLFFIFLTEVFTINIFYER